jgi:hypothetical protein
MSIKKIKIFNVFFLFFFSFLWHFMYKLLPNNIFAIIFPVNESIWEHMKIIYYCLIISSIVEYLLYKRYKLGVNNFYISMMVKSLLGVIVYLIIFVPIYKLVGESMIISISLMLAIYILMEFISYKIFNSEEYNIKVLPIIILVLASILFTILTFFPLHNFLFFDYISFGYGILK